jgi:hypothetical protein
MEIRAEVLTKTKKLEAFKQQGKKVVWRGMELIVASTGNGRCGNCHWHR